MSPLRIEGRVSGTEDWHITPLEARANEPASLDFYNTDGEHEHVIFECAQDDSKTLMTKFNGSTLIKDHHTGKVDILGVLDNEPVEIKPGESIVLNNIRLSEVDAELDLRFTHYKKGQ